MPRAWTRPCARGYASHRISRPDDPSEYLAHPRLGSGEEQGGGRKRGRAARAEAKKLLPALSAAAEDAARWGKGLRP